MKQFNDLVNDVMLHGFDRKHERTGKITRSVFGRQLRFDLTNEFPIVNSKFTPTKAIITELLWLLSGSTNIKFLQDNNCHIWDEWADENGELGPVYGSQWRSWQGYDGETYDQIKQVIDTIKTNPSDRRMIVSAWNVGDIPHMALPPCHAFFQFYVDTNNHLSCQLYQRSCDLMLGVPFNIASYAILTHLIAQVTGTKVGEFIHTFGDLHIYEDHFVGVYELLSRPPITNKAYLWINTNITDIDKFTSKDICVENYVYHSKIDLPIAV